MLDLLSSLFGILVVLVMSAQAQSPAWHMDILRNLVNERLDPVVNPNGISGHMHQVVGGSAFGASYNYADQINAKCTTASITADKSNYWMPKLYGINPDGSFSPIPAGARFYYFLSRNSAAQPVSPFPEGLRMLMGNPDAKSYQGYFSFTCHVNSDLYTGDIGRQDFNFQRDCPYGIRVESNFPQCWDGKNLYLTGNAHMSYPASTASSREGSCPWSHPIRLPQIMLEYTFLPSQWSPGLTLAGQLAWANGDTTGFGVHADFINGWDTAVLGAALNDSQCAGSATSQPIQQCEVFAPYYNLNAAYACSGNPDKGQMNEVGQSNLDLVPISSLPGCNPLWSSGSKPTCASTVNPDVSAWTGTNGALVATGSQMKALVLPTTPGWHEIGCLKDTGAMLTGTTASYYDNSLTATGCKNVCLANGLNYALAGMNDGRWDCQCGTGVMDLASVYPGMCTTPCPGNSSETCGASSVHTVFYAPPGTVTAGRETSTYLGCYYPGTSGTSLWTGATYSFDSSSMTTELCLQTCANHNATWASTSNYHTCRCGNTFTLGGGAFVNDGTCTAPCQGNSTEMCGWGQGGSIYNVTASSYSAVQSWHPAGWKGCYNDPGSAGLTSFSWTSSVMTAEQCVYGCNELGYDLAGVTSGNRCRCGNTWNGGSQYPASQCTTKCVGNATETCGGNYLTEVYDTSVADAQLAADIAARPAGWKGCYANSAGTIFKDYYAYDASLTVERCEVVCHDYGYSWAGVANQYYCRCTNTDPTTGLAQRWPSKQFCTSTCPGNKTETCGAANQYTEAYNLNQTALATAKAAPGNLGCYSGVTGLNGTSWTQTGMTVDICTMGCKELGYSLAGASGTNCYCGNTWNTGGQLSSLSCTQACPGNSSQICGASYITSLYSSSLGADIPPQEAGFIGCYGDSSTKTLAAYSYSSGAMTNAICKSTCKAKGYVLAGTSGTYCYCANTITAGRSRVPNTLCTTTCPGDSTKICGGSYKDTIFNLTLAGLPVASASASVLASVSASASGTIVVSASKNATSASATGSASISAASAAATGSAVSLGCFSDGGTLNGASYTGTYMTVDQCMYYCKYSGFSYAGLTNGNTCRCGNTQPTTNVGRATCTSKCLSNTNQLCGAYSAVDVWATSQAASFVDPYSVKAADATGYMGCWTDWSTRILNGSSYSSSGMTNDVCRANCVAQGFTFSGTEAGNQCYCSNGLLNNYGFQRVADSACSSSCAGDSTQKCGSSSWRISIRARLSALPGASASASASGTATASGSAASASATSTIEGFKGCYANGNFVTGATAKFEGSSVMTTGFCRRYCRNLGFSAAGLQGGDNCYCGSTTSLGTKMKDTSCTISCAGDSSTTCGDTYLTSVYDTTGTGAIVSPGYPANYVGCFTDWTPRVLGNYSYSSNAMTADTCMRVCGAKGFKVYGTESGSQCYCGTAVPTTMTTDNACSAGCSGNSTEKCGATWRISVYSQTWAQAVVPNVVSSTSKAVSSTISISASKSSSIASASASKVASTTVVASPSKAASVTTSPSVTKASSVAASSSKAAASTTAISSKAAMSSAAATSKAAAAASSIGGGLDANPSASKSFASSSTAASVKATSSAKASSTVASASSAAAATPTSTNYVGCRNWPSTSSVQKNGVISSDVMTPTVCRAWCQVNKYEYAGLGKGNTCACVNSVTNLATVAETTCATPCTGDNTQLCGGTSAFNMWKVGSGTCTVAARGLGDFSDAEEAEERRSLTHGSERSRLNRRSRRHFDIIRE